MKKIILTIGLAIIALNFSACANKIETSPCACLELEFQHQDKSKI